MNWLLVYQIAYVIIVIGVSLRIIYDTRSSTKTLAYLLLVIFLPVAGMFFYFSVGVNYRKRKMYSKKLLKDDALARQLMEDMVRSSRQVLEQGSEAVQNNRELAVMLFKDSTSPLTGGNSAKLLINGEGKFPEVLRVLREAKDHIHLEYYIYEDGEIGRTIEELLIQKVKEGVTVRFIYDDFGSRSIRRRLVKRLKAAGVKAFPFHKIIFIALANRLNYRNHRKIIVVDGRTAFVGGINVSDRYINKDQSESSYWRDTHLRIDGPGVHYLQYLFLCDWNFCAKDNVQRSAVYFPADHAIKTTDNKVVQIAASGPDSDAPSIMFSILQAVSRAKKEILITTPYFIPGEHLVDALAVASMSGIQVRILVPGKSDSWLVNLASKSYFADLMKAGAEIYQYTRGFVHAKTIAIDRELAMVGTANLDYRSFDLNFEVNAIVYDSGLATELADAFNSDLSNAERIRLMKWNARPAYKQLLEKAARLLSPLL